MINYHWETKQFSQFRKTFLWERSGSVVECLTEWDRGAAGLSLTGVTALCP